MSSHHVARWLTSVLLSLIRAVDETHISQVVCILEEVELGCSCVVMGQQSDDEGDWHRSFEGPCVQCDAVLCCQSELIPLPQSVRGSQTEGPQYGSVPKFS